MSPRYALRHRDQVQRDGARASRAVGTRPIIPWFRNVAGLDDALVSADKCPRHDPRETCIILVFRGGQVTQSY